MCVVRLGIDKCCYKREVVTGHSPLRGRGAQSAHSTRSTPNDARVSGSEARTKKPLRDREFAFAFAHPCNPHTLNDVLDAIYDQQRKVLKILQFILSYMLSRSICHISESYYWWHAIEPTLATSWLPPITSEYELPCFSFVFSLQSAMLLVLCELGVPGKLVTFTAKHSKTPRARRGIEDANGWLDRLKEGLLSISSP